MGWFALMAKRSIWSHQNGSRQSTIAPLASPFDGESEASHVQITLPPGERRQEENVLSFTRCPVTPTTRQVTPVPSPTLSGLVTGFENGAFTNLPLAGVHLRIYPVTSSESTTPAYEIVTKSDGRWGPFQASATLEYDFDLEFQGRHVRFYKAPIPRSTTLLNFRFLPVPTEPKVTGQGSPSVPTPWQSTSYRPPTGLLFTRTRPCTDRQPNRHRRTRQPPPERYFSC
jgi:hypothetical protein